MALISFISLGCDKNLVDSEVMIGLLKEEGHIITGDEGEAEVIVVNTCCFIEDALKESIETILELGEMKKGSLKAIVVAGCLAERYKEEFFKELPEADVIVGTTAYEDIAEAVEAALLKDNNREFFSPVSKGCNEEKSLKRQLSTVGNYYGYLKIAEGCDNHCTYCVIPSLRGRYRSRTIESLIKESEGLAAQGVKELIIVAQDISLYGKDIYGKIELPRLIEELAKIEDIHWIRLMYCYPENINDALINAMASKEKVCKYIDMPIQHISDKILKLMGRRTTGADIKRIIDELREKIDAIVIRTSLITGFPGETEEDFNQLLEFVESYKLERVGVFPFSREEGTPAWGFENRVSKKIAVKRKNMLLKAQEKVAEAAGAALTGKVLKVMVEGKISNTGTYVCRGYMDAPSVDGYVFVAKDEELLSGDFIETEITGYKGCDLWGI